MYTFDCFRSVLSVNSRSGWAIRIWLRFSTGTTTVGCHVFNKVAKIRLARRRHRHDKNVIHCGTPGSDLATHASSSCCSNWKGHNQRGWRDYFEYAGMQGDPDRAPKHYVSGQYEDSLLLIHPSSERGRSNRCLQPYCGYCEWYGELWFPDGMECPVLKPIYSGCEDNLKH